MARLVYDIIPYRLSSFEDMRMPTLFRAPCGRQKALEGNLGRPTAERRLPPPGRRSRGFRGASDEARGKGLAAGSDSLIAVQAFEKARFGLVRHGVDR